MQPQTTSSKHPYEEACEGVIKDYIYLQWLLLSHRVTTLQDVDNLDPQLFNIMVAAGLGDCIALNLHVLRFLQSRQIGNELIGFLDQHKGAMTPRQATAFEAFKLLSLWRSAELYRGDLPVYEPSTNQAIREPHVIVMVAEDGRRFRVVDASRTDNGKLGVWDECIELGSSQPFFSLKKAVYENKPFPTDAKSLRTLFKASVAGLSGQLTSQSSAYKMELTDKGVFNAYPAKAVKSKQPSTTAVSIDVQNPHPVHRQVFDRLVDELRQTTAGRLLCGKDSDEFLARLRALHCSRPSFPRFDPSPLFCPSLPR